MLKSSLFCFLFVVNYCFAPDLIMQLGHHEAPGTHLLSIFTFKLESGFLCLYIFFFAPCELGVRLCCHPHVCVCVWYCTDGRELSGFFVRRALGCIWRFYLLLLDRLTPEGLRTSQRTSQ